MDRCATCLRKVPAICRLKPHLRRLDTSDPVSRLNAHSVNLQVSGLRPGGLARAKSWWLGAMLLFGCADTVFDWWQAGDSIRLLPGQLYDGAAWFVPLFIGLWFMVIHGNLLVGHYAPVIWGDPKPARRAFPVVLRMALDTAVVVLAMVLLEAALHWDFAGFGAKALRTTLMSSSVGAFICALWIYENREKATRIAASSPIRIEARVTQMDRNRTDRRPEKIAVRSLRRSARRVTLSIAYSLFLLMILLRGIEIGIGYVTGDPSLQASILHPRMYLYGVLVSTLAAAIIAGHASNVPPGTVPLPMLD